MDIMNFRKYGMPPFRTILIHGGPGAAGEMAPFADELSKTFSVLEALQTKFTIEEQIQEIYSIILKHCETPVYLIGHSWGAWLSYIFTAKFSVLVKKLILVASAPFDEKYSKDINTVRLDRLGEEDVRRVEHLYSRLEEPTVFEKDNFFKKLAEIMLKADSYKPINQVNELMDYDYRIFEKIWPEAGKLRNSGDLLKMGRNIKCPVTAIHGDYDSHPVAGVRDPLKSILDNFKIVSLEKCGHEPWNEFYAKNKFYDILINELNE